MSAKKTPKKKPKDQTPGLRSYGRQGPGKTIKSISLDKSLVAWAEAEAAKRKVSLSHFINTMLAEEAGIETADESETG